MEIPLDIQFIINEIEHYGSTITIRSVTDTSYSKWGDASESTSDTSSVVAFAETLSQSDELVKTGIFQSGDKVFYFKPTESNIDRGNRIIYGSNEYEIVNVVEHESGDTTYIIEARAKKV